MKSLNSTFTKLIIISAIIFAGVSLYAQDGAYTGYTPYSVFGLGEINSHGSAWHKGMGGTGIAARSKRYQNYMNPAAVTARDSLSFMADMSLAQNNRLIQQDGGTKVSNVFNMSNIALSFPVYKSSAIMMGIQPYSSTGYDYSYILDDASIIGNTGHAVYSSTGKGGTYKVFASAGVTFWNRLSLGVEEGFYLGKIEKASQFTFAKAAYSTIYSGYNQVLRGSYTKLGLQYEQPLNQKLTLGIGATYSFDSNLKGTTEDYKYTSGSSQNDTLRFKRDTLGQGGAKVVIPSEIGVGISLDYADTWRAEFDYVRSDWTKSGMDVANGFSVHGASSFSTKLSESFRAGFEITPNRNDIRYYYKTCTYRAGVYFDKSYFAVDGNQINDVGITLGASLPVFRYYNAITLAVDLGQRSALRDNLVRERYVNFTIGFNFFDYWFHKQRYE